jgi:hypothetical protein
MILSTIQLLFGSTEALAARHFSLSSKNMGHLSLMMESILSRTILIPGMKELMFSILKARQELVIQ